MSLLFQGRRWAVVDTERKYQHWVTCKDKNITIVPLLLCCLLYFKKYLSLLGQTHNLDAASFLIPLWGPSSVMEVGVFVNWVFTGRISCIALHEAVQCEATFFSCRVGWMLRQFWVLFPGTYLGGRGETIPWNMTHLILYSHSSVFIKAWHIP